MTEPRVECRIYAVIDAGEAALDRLEAALSAAGVASVLIRGPAGTGLGAQAARPLVAAAQRRGAAALIADDARLARTLGADGVHLSMSAEPTAAYAEARSILGARGIVGVDAGTSRHDAMSIAEAGADYVAFGAPAHTADRERRDEFVAWWAEIFEAPCVAFDVETPGEAEALARAGADFVAVTLVPGASPAATAALVAGIAAAVRVPEAAG